MDCLGNKTNVNLYPLFGGKGPQEYQPVRDSVQRLRWAIQESVIALEIKKALARQSWIV